MGHYFSQKPDSGLVLRRVEDRVRNVPLVLMLASGVFASKRIDFGARLLAEKAVIQDGWRVLDLGCGSGVVGLSIAKAYPKCRVILSDINERAVTVAGHNAKLNRLGNCEAVISDGLASVEGSFDTILLNPPQTAGKGVCERLIRESSERLRQGGLLQLVARHNKGGSTLFEYMRGLLPDCWVEAKRGGYRVYVCRK